MSIHSPLFSFLTDQADGATANKLYSHCKQLYSHCKRGKLTCNEEIGEETDDELQQQRTAPSA
ncbi:hypothetical protein GOBAR_DD18643 [Gossypium barbadense]|nr:hypothetical protein GOBAR_DD18643 [Gossypium barbadense]